MGCTRGEVRVCASLQVSTYFALVSGTCVCMLVQTVVVSMWLWIASSKMRGA